MKKKGQNEEECIESVRNIGERRGVLKPWWSQNFCGEGEWRVGGSHWRRRIRHEKE